MRKTQAEREHVRQFAEMFHSHERQSKDRQAEQSSRWQRLAEHERMLRSWASLDISVDLGGDVDEFSS